MILIILVVFLPGCSKKLDSQPSNVNSNSENIEQQVSEDPNIIEIKDKLFIAQCNDIYLNPDEYKNKIIKLEGIYIENVDENTGSTYNFVIRYGPGCCGNDGVAGFEILFDGDKPEPNDWIEVIGAVEIIEENGSEYVLLRLTELTTRHRNCS